MTVTVSLVLVLGVALLVALKMRTLAAGGALLAVLFGFYLADTGASDNVNQLVTAVTDALAGIGR
ncbi:hypothetical protein LRS74_15310 [Streptomyces sp. LX-29]|uniref:hypothetical protein n=1 Tax=Streptomyces sp. LX-29 TaxID=2900152 RepID=UPI00240DE61D|nr:hypothetical protein [Streptomyces sp. LX-29]WFB08269.1 hypothetical protein LRS74_15310 [Streptomyces sp. LX-29]